MNINLVVIHRSPVGGQTKEQTTADDLEIDVTAKGTPGIDSKIFSFEEHAYGANFTFSGPLSSGQVLVIKVKPAGKRSEYLDLRLKGPLTIKEMAGRLIKLKSKAKEIGVNLTHSQTRNGSYQVSMNMKTFPSSGE